MNRQAKRPTSVAFRPGLEARIDKLAKSVGLSRSETISRIMGIALNGLEDPNCGWIKIERSHLLKDVLGI
jgi:hypothetical protein